MIFAYIICLTTYTYLDVLAVLDLRPAHAQYARQNVQEYLAHPIGHGVRGERAIMHVVREHSDRYGGDNEDHREDEVLAEERHDERRRRDDLVDHSGTKYFNTFLCNQNVLVYRCPRCEMKCLLLLNWVSRCFHFKNVQSFTFATLSIRV